MDTLLGSPLPTHINPAIQIAIETGNLTSLRSCFQTNKADIFQFRDAEGNNALELAISLGKVEIVKFLIAQGLELNIHKGLQLAVIHAHKGVAELLLNHEKSLLERSLPNNVVFKLQSDEDDQNTLLGIPDAKPCINKPYNGESLLQLAIKAHSETANAVPLIELLLERGADCNYKGPEGLTALRLAIKSNEDSIVELLLKKGADSNDKSPEGFTALHIAAKNLNVSLVKLLLGQANIRIISKDHHGLNALEIAFKTIQGNTESEEDTLTNNDFQNKFKRFDAIFELLLKKASSQEQHYLFHKAVYNNFPELVELFLKKIPSKQAIAKEATQAARPTQATIDLHAFYKDYWTPLHMAVVKGYTPIVKILLDKGADFTYLNKEKFSPFRLALKANVTEIINLFDEGLHEHQKEKNKVLINNFTEDLKYNFFYALQHGEKEIIEILLERYKDYISITTQATSKHYQWMPLHFAAFDGHLELVKFFLEKGADPMKEDTLKRTPLHLALNRQKEAAIKNAIIDVLLKSKPELLDTTDNKGATALILAIQQNEPKTVSCLLKYLPKFGLKETLHWAASVQQKDTTDIIKYLLNNFEFNPEDLTNALHLVPIHSKIKQKDLLVIVKLLLKKGANLNAPHLRTGRTPLILAIQANIPALVDLLLAQKEIEITIVDKHSLNALNHAASSENLSILTNLLQYYHTQGYLYDQETSPLTSAIKANNKPAVELLLKYFKDPKVYFKALGNTFAWAAEYGHLDIIELILSYGFDVNTLLNTKKYRGTTALSIAAEKGQTEVVEFLLNNNAKPSLPDYVGWPPLHRAIKAAQTETALLIIKQGGPEIHLQVGREDDAPIHLAAEYGLEKVVDALIKKGVTIDIENLLGETALHFAIENAFEGIALSLMKAGADIYSRIDGKMVEDDGNFINCEGFSTLHLAAQSGCINILLALLKRKMDPNIRTNNGITPLHSAARAPEDRPFDVVPIVKALLAAGAKIDCQAFEGHTPIHSSAELGDLEMTKLLVEEFIKLVKQGESVKDIINMSTGNGTQFGYTALQIAIYYRHPPIVQYLLEYVNMAQNRQGWGALELAVTGKVKSKKSSALYLPETPISPYRYPPIFNNRSKEDSIEIAILKPLLAKYLLHFSLSSAEKSDLLSAAIKHEQTEIVEFLLSQAKFSPNDINSHGDYPIQISAKLDSDSTEIMELLIAKGAEVNLKNAKSPLSYAAEYDKPEAIKCLLSHGADLTALDPEFLRNAIHFAVIGEVQAETLKILLEHAKTKNILKKVIDSIDKLGLTSLHLAIIYEQDNEIINLFLNYGADFNKPDSLEGLTPMNFALNLEDLRIAKLLFSVRALPAENTTDPKQWAAFCKILIESGNIFKKEFSPLGIFKKEPSPLVTGFIINAYMDFIFKIFNQPEVQQELNTTGLIPIFNMLHTIGRSTLDYMAGIPMDMNHLSEPPDLSLRTLKTPGSSGVDPRTKMLVSPPRAEEVRAWPMEPTNSAHRLHYKRL